MILLGVVVIRQKICDNEAGFEYLFHDYIVKGYSVQEYVQNGVIIRLASMITIDNGHFINNIIIQSDKDRGFSSTNLILFIYNVNTYNKENALPVTSR